MNLDKNGILPVSCADPEGETGGLDPLENNKPTKPAFNVGHHRPASETPLKWHFVGEPRMAPF